MVDDAGAAPAPPDPLALLRSRSFVVILVFAAVIGVVVSLASWAFLELINQIQIGVFSDLPGDLGLEVLFSCRHVRWFTLTVVRASLGIADEGMMR